MTRPEQIAARIAPMEPLDLGDASPMASGTYRDVFIYPGRDDLVVKVLKPGAAYRPGRPIRNFLKARSVRQLYRFMFREYEAYLESRLSPDAGGLPFPISHLYWLQETTRGLGMVAERIRGASDGPALSLAMLKMQGGLSDAHLDALNGFIRALLALDIVANDTNPENVLLDETGSALRFVLVDGFGDPHPLGLKKLSGRLRADARNRRFEKMAEFLGLRWDEKASRLLRD